MGSRRAEDSLYQSNQSQQGDSETSFLKRKLIEIHQKLLRELELTKHLEEKVGFLDTKNQQLKAQNEALRHKTETKSQQDSRGLQRRLKEADNKAELMRTDLETMRTRIISQMLCKTKLEQAVQSKQELISELDHNNRKLLGQVRNRDIELSACLEDYSALKSKYEQVYHQCDRQQGLYEQASRKESSLTDRIHYLEASLKAEKQKTLLALNQKQSLKKEVSSVKSRAMEEGATVADLNTRIQQEQREKDRLKLTVEKLTNQINQVTLRYKVKEKQLEQERDKPTAEIQKRRKNFLESKELVEKLQSEQKQKQKRSHRRMRGDFSPSPLKHYESPRKDYMDNISEMGKLENILLQSNITKNKLMTEIDKIDGIKIKTNELILKRKQFQQQLSNIEELILQTKAKLRNLNAI